MNEPMVKLAGLSEKTSQKRNCYFIGRLGNAWLRMFIWTRCKRVTRTSGCRCRSGKSRQNGRAEQPRPLVATPWGFQGVPLPFAASHVCLHPDQFLK
jgi:hypothetical protein